MNEPDWAKILQYLHNHNGEIRRTALSDETGRDEVTAEMQETALYEGLKENTELQNTKLGDISETRKHLQNTGLVSYGNSKDDAYLKLTTDGFEVAHERELSRRNIRINRALVFFTFVLVLAQIIGVIPVGDWAKIVVSFVILVGMLVAIHWGNLLLP